MTLKPLNVNLDDLIMAMDDHIRDQMEHVLDLQTGRVITLMTSDLEGDEDEDEDADDESVPPWEREARQEILLVRNNPDRFVDIPQTDAGDAYELMRRFIENVSDVALRDRLADAIAGKGAFRRFKDVLLRHPVERAEWFEFENRQKRREAEEWLESIGIKSNWSGPAPVPEGRQ